MNFLSILSIGIAIICSILGVIVISREKLKEYSIYFFLSCQFTAIWIFANVALPILENTDLALIAARFSFMSGVLIISFLLLFASTFPQKTKKSALSYLILIPTCLFSILSWTNLITVDVIRSEEGVNNIVYGQMYLPYIFYLLVVILSTIYVLSRKQRILENQEKLQARYFLIGVVLSSVFILVTNVLIPFVFRTSFYSRFGPVFMIFFLSITFFAIVKHRLFGINFIVGKLLTYFLTAAIAYITFYAVLAFDNLFLGGAYSATAYVVGILLALLFTLIFLYLNKSFEGYLGKYITYSKYNPEDIKRSYLQASSKELSLENLTKYTFGLLNEKLSVRSLEIILFDKEKQSIAYQSRNEGDVTVNQELINSLIRINGDLKNTITSLEELSYINLESIPGLVSNLKSLNYLLIAKLEVSEHHSGYLFIGPKTSSEAYTQEDLSLLDSIIYTFSTSLGRALLHLETQRFNELLKQKVDEQTTEITKQRDEIAEQLRKERDMMDILGHELRTPLSIARNASGLIEMIMKSDTEQYTSKQKIIENNNKVLENLRREVKILETVLSSTQIDHNKIQLEIVKVDCNDVVNDAVEGLKETAVKKKLELKVELPQETLYCSADRDETQRIIDNLLDNAVKYTQQGSVTIKLEDVGNMVKFSITDTGEGIPKEDIPNLGKKFFRSRMYLDSSSDNDMKVVRPGGTGIGLYVVFNLVKMMGGKVEIQSEVNKGSMFGIYLPK